MEYDLEKLYMSAPLIFDAQASQQDHVPSNQWFCMDAVPNARIQDTGGGTLEAVGHVDLTCRRQDTGETEEVARRLLSLGRGLALGWRQRCLLRRFRIWGEVSFQESVFERILPTAQPSKEQGIAWRLRGTVYGDGAEGR